ncbi:MAG TPA: PorP/SprF family type IX secretion system membrane protein [Saprospiraceae bacterium]|nr:PorP/SprF family type IX secretion system membrane protein [Saprospiraceae bacterium]
MNPKTLFYYSLGLLFCSSALSGQDIHHSQFYTTPLNVNPALTGIFSGDQRYSLNYRRQWFVDDIVRYMTVTGSADIRFYPKKWKSKGLWSGGLLFNYDQAGDSKLGLAHLGVSASYTFPLKPGQLITLGALVGFSQRRFQPDELRWDEQWNGDIFDPTLPSQENFSKTSKSFADLSAGINYRWQKSKRTRLDLGIAAYHLNRPTQEFFDQSGDIKLPIRLNVHLMPQIRLSSNFDLLLHGQYQNQDPFQEWVLGGYVKCHLSTQRGKAMSLLLGLASRLDDALIPKVALEWNSWYAGISYDITRSGFEKYLDSKGGPEFSLVYILTKAHPLTVLKSCPIF